MKWWDEEAQIGAKPVAAQQSQKHSEESDLGQVDPIVHATFQVAQIEGDVGKHDAEWADDLGQVAGDSLVDGLLKALGHVGPDLKGLVSRIVVRGGSLISTTSKGGSGGGVQNGDHGRLDFVGSLV